MLVLHGLHSPSRTTNGRVMIWEPVYDAPASVVSEVYG